jgi:ATP-GRASP peptide maturase of grasp-with-spasm system
MSIVIITNEDDHSTNVVLNWLYHFNQTVYRINGKTLLEIDVIEISENNIVIRNNDNIIKYNDIKAFWHRRSNFKIVPFTTSKTKKPFVFSNQLEFHLKNELKKLDEFLHYKFMQKKSIGNLFNTDINKLITLDIVKHVGLHIPPTLITTCKQELTDFKKKFCKLIIKSISEGILFSSIEIGSVYNYTSVLSEELFKNLSSKFPLTLFQAQVEKKYELRIFYFHDCFFSMAIFSQDDIQTSIDFRKYNNQKPNRTVPFDLPKDQKEKLRALMKKLELNTGSIDMAVDMNNEYIFFEVNPIGQFGMTSFPCNFYLEKKIAEFLSNEKK